MELKPIRWKRSFIGGLLTGCALFLLVAAGAVVIDQHQVAQFRAAITQPDTLTAYVLDQDADHAAAAVQASPVGGVNRAQVCLAWLDAHEDASLSDKRTVLLVAEDALGDGVAIGDPVRQRLAVHDVVVSLAEPMTQPYETPMAEAIPK